LILLHFAFSTRSFVSINGGKTAAAQVIDEVRKHFAGYDKSDPAAIRAIAEDLARVKTAMDHAKRVGQDCIQNPHTRVDCLVEKLFAEASKIGSGT
jgi:hypothetical protein